MKSPLSEVQNALKEKSLSAMTADELNLWIDACDKMEQWIPYEVVKRSWRLLKEIAQQELKNRG